MKVSEQHKRWLLWTGFAGLLGSILVGVGEFVIQFNPLGGYELPNYPYFAQVSMGRLTWGHFLSVLAGPLYFLGYLHLGRTLFPKNPKAARLFSGFGIYSFAVGLAWLGGRVYLALVVKEMGNNPELVGLLQKMAEHNEPLVNVLRVAVVVISILWIGQISRGLSLYAKWMAVFSPALLLASIFALYGVLPSLGSYVLPTAMNATHATVFSLSLVQVSRLSVSEIAESAFRPG